METLSIRIDADAFDKAIRTQPDGIPVLPDGADLRCFVKPNATVGGKAGVVLTFTVQLPDGTFARAQTVTTAANLELAGSVLKGWREGGHI